MKVLITGVTGLVGALLSKTLQASGHSVVGLSRNGPGARARLPWLERAFSWDLMAGASPPEAFDGVDAVVHLAGESVAGRWTAPKRERIAESRVTGTRNLVRGLEEALPRPKVLISTSALGYYGNRGDDVLTEAAGPGSDFLADVCVRWEEEAVRAEGFGIRVVRLRSGHVLSPKGGALGPLTMLTKWGLGGPLGSGHQWWPWVHLDDAVGLQVHTLENDIHGAVNAVSPEPVRQKEFAQALGRV
ncbi:MAG: TIGR01777 family oxidoreductase, partial [Chloroflexi bacterium]|nr:TIGR01777 family oxidoreductase [Chloroflexota bacterium]